MNMNRPDMTKDVKYKDYTNKSLHMDSNLATIREGEILGLQPSDLDFDAADGRGTISVSKTMQRANKGALEKLDPNQVYHTFPDRREGSKSSLILKKPKTKKSNRVLYMTKPLKESRLCKPFAEKPLIRANVQTVCRKCAAAFLHKKNAKSYDLAFNIWCTSRDSNPGPTD